MENNSKKSNKAKSKQPVDRIELAKKVLKGAFQNLHLLLEPHEIPLNKSK